MMVNLLIELALGFVSSAVGQWLASHLAFWPARRCAADTHWAERARRSWSARFVVNGGPAVLLGATAALAARHLDAAVDVIRAVSLPLSVAAGAMWGGLPVAKRLFRHRVTLRDLAGEYAVSFLVLTPTVLVFLLMLLLLTSRRIDATSVGIMAGALVLAVSLSFGLALPLVRWLGLLTPPTPRLNEIVREASAHSGIAPPPVDLLRWHNANAIAFPFARRLAFTPAVLEILSDRELVAVCSHEIAHLQEPASAKLTRLSGILILFPVFTIPVWSHTYGLPGVLVPLAVLFVGRRLLRGFSQRMERRADAAAHSSAADDSPASLAQALEKIYEFNLMPAVMRGKRQTHPHLYDRLIAAGIEPAYPRPEAPTALLSFVAIALLVIITLLPLKLAKNQLAERLDSETEQDE